MCEKRNYTAPGQLMGASKDWFWVRTRTRTTRMVQLLNANGPWKHGSPSTLQGQSYEISVINPDILREPGEKDRLCLPPPPVGNLLRGADFYSTSAALPSHLNADTTQRILPTAESGSLPGCEAHSRDDWRVIPVSSTLCYTSLGERTASQYF